MILFSLGHQDHPQKNKTILYRRSKGFCDSFGSQIYNSQTSSLEHWILDTGIYTLNRTPVIHRALTTSFTSRGNLNLNSHTQHLFRRWKETRESGGNPLRHREKHYTNNNQRAGSPSRTLHYQGQHQKLCQRDTQQYFHNKQKIRTGQLSGGVRKHSRRKPTALKVNSATSETKK